VYSNRQQLELQGFCCVRGDWQFVVGMAGIANERNPRYAGSCLLECFEPLGRELVRQKRDAGRIAAGLR
jgi:hypothetical protein